MVNLDFGQIRENSPLLSFGGNIVVLFLLTVPHPPTHREWLQEAHEHCNVSNFEVYLVATKRDLVVSTYIHAQ